MLITVDTLRRDHLSTYGHFRDTSPNLDALAAEGVLFERALATMATTLPSHLSMFTGLYPHQHGVEENLMIVRGAFQAAEGRMPVAMLLKEAGYDTGAFISAPVVGRASGLHQGFDTFSAPPPMSREGAKTHPYRKGSVTTERALEWLAGRSEKPFFLWIHYWDVHEPNIPPEPYLSRYATDENLRALMAERGIVPEDFPPGRFRDQGVIMLMFPHLLEAYLAGEKVDIPPVTDEVICSMLNRYDGSIRFVDHCIGQVMDELRGSGRWDDTVFAVTSDHGQALGQHDWLGHAEIFNENVFVPLIVRFPDGVVQQPLRVPQTMSVIDLMPTILARFESSATEVLLGQAEGEDVLSGRFERPHSLTERTVKRDMRVDDKGRKFALLTDDWRYVLRQNAPPQLYDLREDPDGYVDVIDEHPGVARVMDRAVKQLIQRRVSEGSLGAPPENAEELMDALRALGYAGDEPQDEE